MSCLDIEQVMVLCRNHHLHDGLISVWNRAMQDYVCPLYELVPLLKTLLDKGIALGLWGRSKTVKISGSSTSTRLSESNLALW